MKKIEDKLIIHDEIRDPVGEHLAEILLKTKLPTINIVNHHHLCFNENEYIGRGSPLGNPFSHMSGTTAKNHVETREDAITAYRGWLLEQIQEGNEVVINEMDRLAHIAMSKGKLVLRCYCAPKPCHGDIIKEFLLTAIQNAE